MGVPHFSQTRWIFWVTCPGTLRVFLGVSQYVYVCVSACVCTYPSVYVCVGSINSMYFRAYGVLSAPIHAYECTPLFCMSTCVQSLCVQLFVNLCAVCLRVSVDMYTCGEYTPVHPHKRICTPTSAECLCVFSLCLCTEACRCVQVSVCLPECPHVWMHLCEHLSMHICAGHLCMPKSECTYMFRASEHMSQYVCPNICMSQYLSLHIFVSHGCVSPYLTVHMHACICVSLYRSVRTCVPYLSVCRHLCEPLPVSLYLSVHGSEQVLLSPRRVKLWADTFGRHLQNTVTKFSGSLLLQKVSDLLPGLSPGREGTPISVREAEFQIPPSVLCGVFQNHRAQFLNLLLEKLRPGKNLPPELVILVIFREYYQQELREFKAKMELEGSRFTGDRVTVRK